MRYLFVLMLVLGCASRPDDDPKLNLCISAGAFAGDRIRNAQTGMWQTVVRVHGPSYRCTDPKFPHLAEVKY